MLVKAQRDLYYDATMMRVEIGLNFGPQGKKTTKKKNEKKKKERQHDYFPICSKNRRNETGSNGKRICHLGNSRLRQFGSV